MRRNLITPLIAVILMTSCASTKIVQVVETPVAIEARFNRAPKKLELTMVRGHSRHIILGEWISPKDKTVRFLPRSGFWLDKCVEISFGEERLPISNIKQNTFRVRNAGSIFYTDRDLRYLNGYKKEPVIWKGSLGKISPEVCSRLNYPPIAPRPKIGCDIAGECTTLANDLCKKIHEIITQCKRKSATKSNAISAFNCQGDISKMLRSDEKKLYKSNTLGHIFEGLLEDLTKIYFKRGRNAQNWQELFRELALTGLFAYGSYQTEKQLFKQCKQNVLDKTVGKMYAWRQKTKSDRERIDRMQSICIERGHTVPKLRDRIPIQEGCYLPLKKKSKKTTSRNNHRRRIPRENKISQVAGSWVGPEIGFGLGYANEIAPSTGDRNQGAEIRARVYLVEAVGRLIVTPDRRGAFDLGGGLSLFEGNLLNPYLHLTTRRFMRNENLDFDPYFDCPGCRSDPYLMLNVGNRFSLPLPWWKRRYIIAMPVEWVHSFSDRLPDMFRISLNLRQKKSY